MARRGATGRRVLLLDDDPEFRDLVCPTLRDHGFVVDEAGTVAGARAQLLGRLPDVAIIDGVLPDESGVDFVSELHQRHGELPIIFITGQLRDFETRQRLVKECGVKQVIHKPVSPAEFLIQVKAATAPHSAPAIPRGKRLASALPALQASYLTRVPEKLMELREALRRARGGDASALAHAYRSAHKLHGTSGSYGLPAIGGAAGALEQAIPRDAATVPSADQWVEIDTCLARLETEAQTACRDSQPDSAPPPAPSGAGHRTDEVRPLLVVDDDGDFLEQVKLMGRQLLVEVLTARGEEEALEIARSNSLRGALLDIHMGPGNDAFRLGRMLRSARPGEALPLSFISADARVPNRVAAVHAGASLFVRKPFGVRDLEAVVQHFQGTIEEEYPRVLILDDDPDFADLTESILRAQGMHVDKASQPMKILDVLESRRPDILLLDLIMPELSGLEICRMLRASAEWRNLLIFFLTAHTGPEARLACFEAGADDYIPKPVLEPELSARLRVRLDRERLARDRSDRDPLTGLQNRRAFVEQVTRQLSDAHRRRRHVSLALLDLDHFKRVNDEHGHLSGDRVLAATGKLLQRSFRTEDLRARWGGEEFAIVFDGEDAGTCKGVIERVLSDLSDLLIKADDGTPIKMGCSAGVATFPEDGSSIDELIKVADERLYASKRGGRGKVTIDMMPDKT